MAYLARRTTDATWRELARELGLSRPDSVPNLTRRIEKALAVSPGLRHDLRAIKESLRGGQETKNKDCHMDLAMIESIARRAYRPRSTRLIVDV